MKKKSEKVKKDTKYHNTLDQIKTEKTEPSTTITIDEAKVDLHVFTAQPVSDEPVRKFYQISTVQNGIGYSVTGTSPVTVSDSIESQVIAIVQSVHFVPIASAATK